MGALGRLRAFVDRTPTRAERQRFAAVMTAETRAYPEQWQLGRICVEGPDPLVVVEANRRAGKTQGIGTAVQERLITQDNYKAIQVTHNLEAPTKQWWDRKGATSGLDLLGSWATHAHIHRAGLGAIKSITFPWGSQLSIIVVQTVGDVDKLRGLTADLYWVDEAQDVTALSAALTSGIFPTLADSGGRVILSGTPGLDPESYYGRAVRGAQADDIGSAWAAASVWSWENPAFGATTRERWKTIVDRTLRPAADSYRLDPATLERLAALTPEELPQLREATDGPLKGLRDGLDDRVKREYFAVWSGSSSPAVFPAWTSVRYWARENDLFGRELDLIPSSIAERVKVLPHPTIAPLHPRDGQRPDPRPWQTVVTADMGYDPDPVAIGVLASHPGRPGVKYELLSETHLRMPDGDVFGRLAEIVTELQTAGVTVSTVVADLSGDRAGTRAEWDRALVRRVREKVPVQVGS